MQADHDDIVSGTNVYVTNRVFSYIGPRSKHGDFESGYGPGQFLDQCRRTQRFDYITTACSFRRQLPARHPSTAAARRAVVMFARASPIPTLPPILGGFRETYLREHDPVVLTYWYLPTANSSKLRLNWAAASTARPALLRRRPRGSMRRRRHSERQQPIVHLFSGRGDCYVDDVVLVAGTNAVSAQPAAEWRFESALSPIWIIQRISPTQR